MTVLESTASFTGLFFTHDSCIALREQGLDKIHCEGRFNPSLRLVAWPIKSLNRIRGYCQVDKASPLGTFGLGSLLPAMHVRLLSASDSRYVCINVWDENTNDFVSSKSDVQPRIPAIVIAITDTTVLKTVMMQEVARPLSVDERTLVLATAVSIDFDYFSQHSHGSGLGFMPWLMPIPTPSPSYPEDGDAGAPPADVPPGDNLFDAASSVLHLYRSHLPFSDR